MWLFRDPKTELKASTQQLVTSRLKVMYRVPRRLWELTTSTNTYFNTAKKLQINWQFFQSPKSLDSPDFFLLSFSPQAFPQVRKPEVLPGYRPIWPMTCHLTLLWANALRSTTGWAPAGQLARLLAWSYANEKPRETSIHLNSQMGGRRQTEKRRHGGGRLGPSSRTYWGVFTEEFG